MTTTIRRAVACAALTAALSAVLTACGGSSKKDDSTPGQTPSAPAVASPEASSAAPSAPSLSIGQSGTFTAMDSYSEAKTQMRVTVVSARYVTPAQVGTTNKPKGQYVDLKITVKNVGSSPVGFSTYGLIKWEDSSTAAQDATTLEGIGSGPDLEATYKPGQSVTGDVILDDLHKGGTLTYWNNLFGDGPSFTIKLPTS